MTGSSEKFKSAQEILDDLHALWVLAERLEKESLESFDGDDPIMEQLGFA